MSLRIPNFYLQLPFSPHSKTQKKLSVLHYRRGWKRRKLKLLKSTQTVSHAIRSNFDINFFDPSAFENLFQSLISRFPSVNSMDILAPALGLASGGAVYLSQSARNSKLISNLEQQSKFVGEWILFTSPTPFNRFVILRCPSITLEGELLEDVNEKLVKEDTHFVRLNRGRIQLRDDEIEEEVEKLVYQRVCIGTEDGGVISLDWPANLDLREERGLDTTMLIVPGTAEGSLDKEIKAFVCECLRRGYFPVVMNPRGCAGSPLTTPRLFTAADSDDISTAIQFINKARPWTTMMSIGWGYGANMLSKYLAEAGERTPLTAATCIDNPFDLDETTRSTPHRILLDQKLKTGLIGILRSNKELFQGRAKGFDVEKALLAASVRDFEREISMVSYGFDQIEDFYAKSSTRDMIGRVKIPLLFIQNNYAAVPLFSTPRSLIAENPFTSLLLCSYLPSSRGFSSGRSTCSWCQQITIEWLTAVELGLLKGRHPLLTDVDVTITPAKGLTKLESRSSFKNGKRDRLLNVPNFDTLAASSNNNVKQSFEGSYMAPKFPSRSKQESKGLQKENTVSSENSKPFDLDPVGEEIVNSVDGETGQVLQTARVVIKMLDVTMPDTLTEEQTKKVLMAVGRGESIIKALQDAVPEDVRGKLTTAVSGILNNKGSTLNMDKLLGLGQIPEVASQWKLKVQEKAVVSNANSNDEDTPTTSQTQRTDLADGHNGQPTQHKAPMGLESELHASEHPHRSTDSSQLKSTTGHESNPSDLDNKAINDLGSGKETSYSSREGTGQVFDSKENLLDSSAQSELPGRSEGAGISEDKQYKEMDFEKSTAKGESTNPQNEVKTVETSVDETKSVASVKTEDEFSIPVSISENQSMEKEDGDSSRREENRPQAGSMDDSKLPNFDVSQGLDALTGIDDSTQVAVNSVFNVIEDMIDQFEEGRTDANQTEDVVYDNKDGGTDNSGESKGRVEDQQEKVDSISKNHIIMDDSQLEKLKHSENYLSLASDTSHDMSSFNQINFKEESAGDSSLLHESSTHHLGISMYEGNGRMKELHGRKLSAESHVNLEKMICHPGALSITTNLYVDPLYREYLRKYLISKMKIMESPELDSTLFLDYFPEENKWKLLEMTEDENDINEDVRTSEEVNPDAQAREDIEDVIEPSYVILDADLQDEQDECEKANKASKETGDDTLEELLVFVKSIILDTLKVEVNRRVSRTDIEEMQPKLSNDFELVANAVCLSLGHEEHTFFHRGKGDTSDRFGVLEGLHIVNAISSAVQETIYLRKLLPVGVIVGSSLASLRKYFGVSIVSTDNQKEVEDLDLTQQTLQDADKLYYEQKEKKEDLDIVMQERRTKTDTSSSNGSNLMVGAVTAALGASALLVEQQNSGATQTLSKPLKDKGIDFKGHKNEEKMPENAQNCVVTSLAEKALSVASPVVPTKEDGEVDQERLLAMLAELGQKGGILRFVGKIALLWGGMRGALSLIEKLILFLRLAERPLSHRIFGFAFMVIVLWSPVVVPLLPTLVQSWANHQSPRIAELACVVGLYVSVMLMVTLWGKRIRGYDNPLQQYGLDLISLSKVHNFAKGFLGGAVLVSLINCINLFCGFAQLSLPSYLSASSSNVAAWLKLSGRTMLLVIQGLATAIGVAAVEELLFRSWLPDEIGADLGYYHGVIISGLAFSLSQRSLWAIPGLWLLSVALAGARQRSQGSLSLSIGLRAGILASSSILRSGGFLTYNPSTPVWLCGSHPFEPFSGLVGLAFSVLMAAILYPRQPPIANVEFRSIKSE